MCKRLIRFDAFAYFRHLPIARIFRNYLALDQDTRLMRDRPMNIRPLRLGISELFVFSVLILSGCASHPDTGQQAATYEEDFNDPLEDTNRKIFAFNQFVDRNAIAPGLPFSIRISILDNAL